MRFPLLLLLLPVLLLPLVVWAQDGNDEKKTDPVEERYRVKREKMVKLQLRSNGIKDEEVLRSMGKVKRHRLALPKYRHLSYEATPLPIGYGQTISKPYVVALMTELLDLESTHRVLEVGTGSGYQAAVLAEIVAKVHSIEIYRELYERTKKNLQELGYENVQLRHGDGALGWKEHGPFDAIIVTCAASHIPPALIEQLKPGGRMCIPVGPRFGAQRLLLVTKKEDGKTTTKTITGVRFVPLLAPGEVKSAPREDEKKGGAKQKRDSKQEEARSVGRIRRH